MKKKGFLVIAFVFAVGLMLMVTGYKAGAQQKAAGAKAAVERNADVKTCYGCHDPIKELHSTGRHTKVNCVNCHSGLAKHVEAPGPDTRPATNTSW